MNEELLAHVKKDKNGNWQRHYLEKREGALRDHHRWKSIGERCDPADVACSLGSFRLHYHQRIGNRDPFVLLWRRGLLAV